MNEKLRSHHEGEPTELSPENAPEYQKQERSMAEFSERLRILAHEKKMERAKKSGEAVSERSVGEFLDNLKEASGPELQEMCSTIDYLLVEWDPAYHDFLRNIKAQIQALIETRGSVE